MTVRRGIVRKHVPREAYFVFRAGLARLARKTGLVGSFIFMSRACRARLAYLAHNSRTTSDEVRRSGSACLRAPHRQAIAVEVFMNHAVRGRQDFRAP